MDLLQTFILSIVQGLTEFLPISSSGHLILVPKLLQWPDQGLAFDAIIHLGTAAASAVYFREEIARIIRGFFGGDAKYRRLGWALLLSTLPAVFAGFFLESFIEESTRTVLFVAVNLLFWGVILIIADRWSARARVETRLESIGYGKALMIGIAQSLALLPGTSRSGITISAGLLQGVKREDAVTFSFLMSIPVILGAGLLNLFELAQGTNGAISGLQISVALLGAFASGIAAIAILLRFINRGGLTVFGIYRILLAVLLLVFFAS